MLRSSKRLVLPLVNPLTRGIALGRDVLMPKALLARLRAMRRRNTRSDGWLVPGTHRLFGRGVAVVGEASAFVRAACSAWLCGPRDRNGTDDRTTRPPALPPPVVDDPRVVLR
ncbi:hypothetical protein GCM10023335_66940 [Streptomyces siamensis]|uniref:Uncharacterized protein n=1 Tax=Streptomyces siamensis TaxID=1274986 RepID=A0ABP9JDP2_9ACTN